MDDILQELSALSAQFPENFERRELKNPNNQWFVRSALQKAIRRGQEEEAISMARYMLGIDEAKAWQAFAIIMVEDVGIGDLDLLAYSTVTTLKTKVRDKLDADLLYGAMVLRACRAPKSRSCCELELGVNMIMGVPDRYTGEVKDTVYRQILNHLLSMELTALGYHIVLRNPPTLLENLEYAHIASLALRKRLRGMGDAAMFPTLARIKETLDDATEQRAAMLCFDRCPDTMNLALFPLLQWLNVRDEDIVEQDEKSKWPEPKMIGPFWAEVLDMHTRQGKQALKAWHKHLCKVEPTFKTMENPGNALGAIAFVIEGGLVDRRLHSPGLALLRAYQDVNFIRGYGAGEEIMAELPLALMCCTNELSVLHELRLLYYSK